MFRTLTRLLAVCLLALSPLWGVGSVAARPAGYPVWPSFLSTGCNSVSSSAGGTTTVCGVGGSLLTQVNSGYPCNRLDIGISSFSSGPFIITGLADSESIQNTITVNDTGDYTMDFPGFLVNNSIIIQMSAPDSGSMTVAYIQTIPCPVQPTATNTLTPSNTPTPNPSDTATNTATPGPSHTPTAIPTYTPLPSGHSTFTQTVTRTPTPGPATATGTATPPGGLTQRNCGIGITFYDCDIITWGSNIYWSGNPQCGNSAIRQGLSPDSIVCFSTESATQTVTVPGNGQLSFTVWCTGGSGNWFGISNSTGTPLTQIQNPGGTCVNNPGQTVSWTVTAAGTYQLWITLGGSIDTVHIDNVTFVYGVGVNTATPTSTSTGTATGTATPPGPTSTPTQTPLPIPGAQSTPIPTDTPCPGGCAVGQLTQVPGFATRVLVDTSPFSALEHLSLARSSCQPFGYVQIPVPVIHGTPALGSTTPLSFTWTAPVTHTWDDTNVFSNTALQPCAMVNEIPSFVWDLTYWLSVLMCAVGWFMWLIGFVGRLSGEETING